MSGSPIMTPRRVRLPRNTSNHSLVDDAKTRISMTSTQVNKSTEELINEKSSVSKKWLSKRWWNRLICYVSVAMFTFTVGVVIGYAILYYKIHSQHTPPIPSLFAHVDEDQHKFMQSKISSAKIKENLRLFTSKPHLAGDELNCSGVSREIHDMWQRYLGDIARVDITPYYVLLSIPQAPGYVKVTNDNSTKPLFKSRNIEKALIREEEQYYRVYPYNAYSATGTQKGDIVYANYGLMSDFLYLRQKNISVAGKIVLIRYGKCFRANKVQLAEKYGAIAVILFSDPLDYSLGKVKYPDSWWLPPDGVQRGTVNHLDADPSTIGYPADKTDIYYTDELHEDLPKIPVHPISYGDAEQLMSFFDGEIAPTPWQGKMNVTYRLDTSPKSKNKFTVNVNIAKQPKRKICNVIATIPGDVEPDRIVMLGNHHDAWVYGALDPSSGTAVLTEIVRSLGEGLRNGWNPRRTLMIASWDAEEFGLLGSNEWVEENIQMVSNDMVAYLNVDSAIQGNFTLTAKSSSQIQNVLFTAASNVKDPDASMSTLFEEWSKKVEDKNNLGFPRIRIPASGSDFKTFINRFGVPVTDIRYDYDWDVVGKIASAPNYHSLHDTMYLVENFVDPDFRYSRAVAETWLIAGLILADDELLPFNFTDYARTLSDCTETFVRKNAEIFTRQQLLDFRTSQVEDKAFVKAFVSKHIQSSLKKFIGAVEVLNNNLLKLEFMHDELHVRALNDRLMQVERAFIAPHGLDGRPYSRHVIYGPSRYNSYGGHCFPGLLDEILDIRYNGVKEDSALKIRNNMALINYHLQQAVSVIEKIQ